MKKKCDQYKALFIFKNNDEFKNHLENCPECKLEQEKMDKISSLIKEAKPLYLKRKRQNQGRKFASIAAIFVLCIMTIPSFNTQNTLDDTYENILCAEDYGFPVDSYGFILVN